MTAVFLAGNLSEGFVAYGPYEDFGAACDAHDGHEGWGMTLTPLIRAGMRRFTVVGVYDDANYALGAVGVVLGLVVLANDNYFQNIVRALDSCNKKGRSR